MALDEIKINNLIRKKETLSRVLGHSPETGVPTPEQVISPEVGRTGVGQVEIGRPTSEITSQGLMEMPGMAAQPAVDPMVQRYQRIEQILEEDFGEIYNNLSPQEQKLFKIKGEEAARSIFQLVYHKSKVKVKKIIKMIKEWLKTIPGINKFFLEQEAKIKADKIVALIEEDKKIKF